MADKILKSINFPGLEGTYYIPETTMELDTTLTQEGSAADAKAVGEALAGKANSSEVTSALADKVPTTRKINNKALTSDISLTASDVGAPTRKEALGTATLEMNNGYLNFYTAPVQSGSASNQFIPIHPVGSIYMSLDSRSPASIFGGTWERIMNRFLFAAHDATGYPGGATGGEATHTLTTEEMPSHRHEIITIPLAAADQAWNWGDGNLRGAGSNLWSEYAGGSQPHNNMPPYLCVYMWKRTA